MNSSKAESARRILASVFQWGGWAGAVAIFAYATVAYDPNKMHFAPQWIGFSFIFCLGLAIAGTTARSRMRLSDTIVGAFKAGFDAAEERGVARESRTEERGIAREGRNMEKRENKM